MLKSKCNFIATASLICLAIGLLLIGCKKENAPQEEEETSYAPDVQTFDAKDVTNVSATLWAHANPNGQSLTSAGFYYGTSPNLDSESQMIPATSLSQDFSAVLTDLLPNTTYYFKAFAENKAGKGIGSVISFTTERNLAVPVVFAFDALYVGVSSAKLSAKITDDGGSAVTVKGFLVSTDPNFGNATLTPCVTPDSEFSEVVDNLSCNTTYYYKAVVINEKGAGHSVVKSFTTENGLNAITGDAYQTYAEFRMEGFPETDNFYHYKYSWTMPCTFENTWDASEIGVFFLEQHLRFDSVMDGTQDLEWTCYSNNPEMPVSYKAFARRSDGMYVYGGEKHIFLVYE